MRIARKGKENKRKKRISLYPSKKKLVVYFDSILLFVSDIKFKSKLREFIMHEITCTRKVAKKCNSSLEREN